MEEDPPRDLVVWLALQATGVYQRAQSDFLPVHRNMLQYEQVLGAQRRFKSSRTLRTWALNHGHAQILADIQVRLTLPRYNLGRAARMHGPIPPANLAGCTASLQAAISALHPNILEHRREPARHCPTPHPPTPAPQENLRAHKPPRTPFLRQQGNPITASPTSGPRKRGPSDPEHPPRPQPYDTSVAARQGDAGPDPRHQRDPRLQRDLRLQGGPSDPEHPLGPQPAATPNILLTRRSPEPPPHHPREGSQTPSPRHLTIASPPCISIPDPACRNIPLPATSPPNRTGGNQPSGLQPLVVPKAEHPPTHPTPIQRQPPETITSSGERTSQPLEVEQRLAELFPDLIVPETTAATSFSLPTPSGRSPPPAHAASLLFAVTDPGEPGSPLNLIVWLNPRNSPAQPTLTGASRRLKGAPQ